MQASDAIQINRRVSIERVRSQTRKFGKSLWIISFRNLWVRKARTLVTASGIMLGVAAVFAISVMSASTTQSLKDFFAQVSGRANLSIGDAGRSGEGMPERTFHRVLIVPGVAAAAEMTTNRATLLENDKTTTISVTGIDPDFDRRLRTYTLVEGRFLSQREKAHNILLVTKFAADHNIKLGDSILLRIGSDQEEKFKVIGLLADEGAGHLNGGSIGFVTLDVADNVYNRGGKVDQIDLIADAEVANSSTRLAQLKDTLQNLLGKNFVVSFPTATGESVSQALSGLNVGLGIFGVIALFVGMLLIYNTFAMTIAERTREIGMLRSLGATKRQVLTLVLGEAAFLGVIGATLGILCGLLLSIPLVKFMSQLIGLPLDAFSIPLGGLIQAVLVGFITTLIAAFLPAWQASRISPTEALRARGGGREGFLMRHGWKVGAVLLGLAVLDGSNLIHIFEGAQFFMASFTGTILIMPNLIILIERYGRSLISRIYGAIGNLGSRNLARSKGRTSLTVGVLMIGVVMNVAIGAMSVSFKASIDDWINAAVGGDYFISSPETMRTDLANDLLAVNGIAAVTPERLVQIKISGTTNADGFKSRDDSILMLAVDTPTYRDVSSFQFNDGEDPDTAMNELARGESVFISTVLRDRWKLKNGDSLRLRTGHGERDFRVVGVVSMFYQGGQSFIISRRDLEKYWGDTRVSIFIAKVKPELDSADVQSRLKNGIGKTKNLEITAGDEFRKNFSTQIQQFFMLFDAMVWISVIVGALGVINTMTMNILERVREIGTMRSIGMNRAQLAQMVMSEAMAMGALGSLFGIAVALPISTVMVQGMSQGSGFPMRYVFPAMAFIIGVIVALVISQLAALYPTWRASKISVTEAIRAE